MSKLFIRMIVAVFVVLGEWAVANYFLGWHKPFVWWISLYVMIIPLIYVFDLLGTAANKACTGRFATWLFGKLSNLGSRR